MVGGVHHDRMTTMNETIDVRGLWVPLVTPFDARGEVDEAALDALCRRVLEDGAIGVVVLGTTGEPAVLTDGEQEAVVEICSGACTDLGRPLIVMTASPDNNVRESAFHRAMWSSVCRAEC